MQSTRRDILRLIREAIEPLYGEREADQIARLVLSERAGISLMELLVDPMQPLELEGLKGLIEQLRAGRPVQYLLGHTEFCGLDLLVREGVLIPRPETEELVGHILRRAEGIRSILDIGTGSGAIACVLKKSLPEVRVVAVDLSKEALAIARENAARHQLEIEFREGDALNYEALLVGESFDLIVSNPPYIPACEEVDMRLNVTKYEPSMALFVPDEDPLCFYRAIARAARRLLTEQGSLWFELHENYAEATASMLREEGFSQSRIYQDLFDKPRMLWSSR